MAKMANGRAGRAVTRLYYLSILRLTSDTSTFPRTIRAHAKYRLCFGSVFNSW